MATEQTTLLLDAPGFYVRTATERRGPYPDRCDALAHVPNVERADVVQVTKEGKEKHHFRFERQPDPEDGAPIMVLTGKRLRTAAQEVA